MPEERVKVTITAEGKQALSFFASFRKALYNTARASKVTSDQMQAATARLKGFMSGLTRSLQSLSRYIGYYAGAAITGFIVALRSASKAASEQQKIDNQLAAVLKSTGRSFPIEQVKEWASALQESSVYGSRNILEAQKILSTYPEISDKIFPEATKAAVDFAAYAGISVESAAKKIGRLAKGTYSSMEEFGIAFSQATKDSGSFTAALDELLSKVGGQALAQLDTFGGRLQQLGNYWGSLREKLGMTINLAWTDPLIRIIERVREFNADLQKMFDTGSMDPFIEKLQVVGDAIANIAIKLIDWFGKTFLEFKNWLENMKDEDLQAWLDHVARSLEKIGKALVTFTRWLIWAANIAIEHWELMFAFWLTGKAVKVIRAMEDMGTMIRGMIQAGGGAKLKKLGSNLTYVGKALGFLVSGAGVAGGGGAVSGGAAAAAVAAPAAAISALALAGTYAVLDLQQKLKNMQITLGDLEGEVKNWMKSFIEMDESFEDFVKEYRKQVGDVGTTEELKSLWELVKREFKDSAKELEKVGHEFEDIGENAEEAKKKAKEFAEVMREIRFQTQIAIQKVQDQTKLQTALVDILVAKEKQYAAESIDSASYREASIAGIVAQAEAQKLRDKIRTIETSARIEEKSYQKQKKLAEESLAEASSPNVIKARRQELEKIEQEHSKSVLKIQSDLSVAYAQGLKKEYETRAQHLQKVKDLQRQRLDAERATADAILSIQTTAASPVDQLNIKFREANRLLNEAAKQIPTFPEKAIELAQRAQGMFAGLAQSSATLQQKLTQNKYLVEDTIKDMEARWASGGKAGPITWYRQIEKLEEARKRAREAEEKGLISEAERYYKQAFDLAKGLEQAPEGIGMYQARAVALSYVEKAGKELIAFSERQSKIAEEANKKLTDKIEKAGEYQKQAIDNQIKAQQIAVKAIDDNTIAVNANTKAMGGEPGPVPEAREEVPVVERAAKEAVEPVTKEVTEKLVPTMQEAEKKAKEEAPTMTYDEAVMKKAEEIQKAYDAIGTGVIDGTGKMQEYLEGQRQLWVERSRQLKEEQELVGGFQFTGPEAGIQLGADLLGPGAWTAMEERVQQFAQGLREAAQAARRERPEGVYDSGPGAPGARAPEGEAPKTLGEAVSTFGEKVADMAGMVEAFRKALQTNSNITVTVQSEGGTTTFNSPFQ